MSLPNSKRILLLEPAFDQILVSSKNGLEPYLEIFIQEGENVAQKKFGTIFGVLEITDHSEDSSYIVNYIISIIKKEYFSKEKRGPIESIEAALHKANLALAKLAQHENIGWIGNFNALIAIIEKNNLHFSQAGKASALLIRNKTLTDISEGMSEENETPNPLKTFTNISSGKLEEGDKLILTTPETFEIFSQEEIKKATLRFSKEKFIQFLKTALGNELEKTAVLVSDIYKKILVAKQEPPKKQSSPTKNAFSQKSFSKFKKKTSSGEISPQDLDEALEKEKYKKNESHIYIKEDSDSKIENNGMEKSFAFAKDKASSFWKNIKNLTDKPASVYPEKLPVNRKEKNKLFSRPTGILKKEFEKIDLNQSKEGLKKVYKKSTAFVKKSIGLISEKINNQTERASKKSFQKISNSSEKISSQFKALTEKQKFYVIVILILIFIISFFVAKWIGKKENDPTTEIKNAEISSSSIAESQNNNPSELTPQNIAEIFHSESAINNILPLNGELFLILDQKIIRLKDKKESLLPEDFGIIQNSTAMNDLGLIFLANAKNEILSFSPSSEKFQSNSISFPSEIKISSLGSYLTYLYVLDENQKKIYRYPRAEGGFGEKFDWLRDTTDLSGFSLMSVSDDIFLAKNNVLIKFRKGKQEISKEGLFQSAKNIFTDGKNVYILDGNQGKIIKTDLDGNIQKEINLPEIVGASNVVSLPQEENKIFFVKDNQVFQIEL